MHASQRCRALVDLKRDRVNETHAMRLYALPTPGDLNVVGVKETHASVDDKAPTGALVKRWANDGGELSGGCLLLFVCMLG
jgi:hypothetical protein